MSVAPIRRRRLHRSDRSGPGLARVRRGRGFTYLDGAGERIDDAETLARVHDLAIPPAWRQVWICSDPLGHLQATGIDAAGRKQYLYHPRWRELRDRQKFQHMVDFARSLPRLRRRLAAGLQDDGLGETRVLACAVRLLDVGCFRIGSEEYADDEGGVGLATVGRSSVRIEPHEVVFDYLAKGGIHRVQAVGDPAVREVVTRLVRRRSGGEQLLAYKQGRRWHRVRSEQINDYLKAQIGTQYSAKDFRTWNATVLAAVSLAVHGGEATSPTARKRAINGAVREVASMLGNTPAVARRSYIDPRVFDRYQSGSMIAGVPHQIGALVQPDDRRRQRLERAVLELLDEDGGLTAIRRAAAA